MTSVAVVIVTILLVVNCDKKNDLQDGVVNDPLGQPKHASEDLVCTFVLTDGRTYG